MSKIRFGAGEVILADLSPSRRSVVFPVLELILVTGVLWLGVGALDAHLATVAVTAAGYVPENLGTVPDLPGAAGTALPALWGRRVLLVLWVWAAWRRCVRQLVFRHRSRIILTDRRLITASGAWRSTVGEIPLTEIVDVRHRGGTVQVWTRGYRVPLRLPDVPWAGEFAAMLNTRITAWARPVY